MCSSIMIEQIKKRLDSARFIHSMEVAELSKKLAKQFGADEEKAYTAGILHDCAKKIPFDEAEALCKACGMELTEIELKNPALIHAPLGAELAKREFGIEDDDIYNAIKYHTTARAGMSILEKIVYVSDMAEPRRSFDGVEEIRSALKTDLDEGVLAALKFTVKFNIDRGRLLHPGAVSAWNDIKLKKEKY